MRACFLQGLNCGIQALKKAMQIYYWTVKHAYFLIFLIFLFTVNVNITSAQNYFNGWLLLLQQDAVETGVSTKTAKKVTQHINFIPSFTALDWAQPEFINTFFDYYYQRVDALKSNATEKHF